MSHKVLVITISLYLTACALSEQENAEVTHLQKPNLVFVLTDEQRYDTSAPYGNAQIRTPNLNKLGEEGIVFINAYVTQPHCSPARSTILTGLYPHTTGVTTNNIPLPEAINTLPELIDDSEYATAYIGKWHLGNELEAWQGFETRISTEDGYTGDATTKFSDYHYWLLDKGYVPDNKDSRTFSRSFAATLPYAHTKSKFMEEEALAYLEAHQNNPFILYLGFLEPHTPNTGPFNDLHDPAAITLDETYGMPLKEDAPLREHIIAAASKNLDIDALKTEMAKYWGLVHQVDLSVGAIREKLHELNLEENTIIVYTSEHGKMMGKFNLAPKRLMYEPSSRIPWIMHVPAMHAVVITQAVSHIDLVPTLLELVGKKVPDQMQGKSLLPLITGESATNDPVFIEWNPFLTRRYDKPDSLSDERFDEVIFQRMRTVVTQDGWKLNWSEQEIDQSQLFNLQDDPQELHNLYEVDEYQNKVRELKEIIKTWQQQTSDTVKME
ncbi:arylsulfatase A-like enzyme [Catalinimonas alkaloidigena]|uniref:sulfatase family protein n=1 Tax=Catalinimonas alkaloidigena TaxID=1075417 RepID=UPI0024060A10|nr:sulfatase-like hydrolase/transferase [Catalinimonas alkaloidigena]MDF9797773.1 arylsulfatase A-like enzyme [Catalinimonas alkaloidigena]